MKRKESSSHQQLCWPAAKRAGTPSRRLTHATLHFYHRRRCVPMWLAPACAPVLPGARPRPAPRRAYQSPGSYHAPARLRDCSEHHPHARTKSSSQSSWHSSSPPSQPPRPNRVQVHEAHISRSRIARATSLARGGGGMDSIRRPRLPSKLARRRSRRLSRRPARAGCATDARFTMPTSASGCDGALTKPTVGIGPSDGSPYSGVIASRTSLARGGSPTLERRLSPRRVVERFTAARTSLARGGRPALE